MTNLSQIVKKKKKTKGKEKKNKQKQKKNVDLRYCVFEPKPAFCYSDNPRCVSNCFEFIVSVFVP